MYQIRIKGRNDLMLEIKDIIGFQIKQDWKDYLETKKDAPVEISGWSGKLSDIKDFNLINTEYGNNEVNKLEIDYRDELRRFRELSAEEKANKLGFFQMVYYGFTEKNSQEVKMKNGLPIEDEVIKIQKKFFTENPKRRYCDPIFFRPLVKSTSCNKAIIRIIENIIAQDNYAEKHL